MSSLDAKELARARVADLARAFKRNESDYLQASYNETQARTDFITPLLEVFGWDIHNLKERPLALREVIEEATVEVGEERLSKRPDYELRLARQRKLFVEAKKPSIHIESNRAAAFQTRRYGYSASLPIAIVTNFHQLVIYDCRSVPMATDEAHVARLLLASYEEFAARFDELWPLLSREAVYSGAFDKHFAVDTTRRGAEQFDDFFLAQVRDWRKRLAIDIHRNTPGLSANELTYSVQVFLSRIVFLRICEDREIEKYETLKSLDHSDTFRALLKVLHRADEFYDSGLFQLLDDERLGIRISDETLKSIIGELYYPQSPYTFAVVKTEVLGEIYEQFLGEIITIVDGAVTITSKPEIRKSGGVVPTPGFIADAIVERALTPAILGKSPAQLEGFTVADICCGSGIFLLSAYNLLLDHYLSWYLSHDRKEHVGVHIYEGVASQSRLTFSEKRRILLAHLRGVDIDPNAVEVARFSLLLKLIEDESAVALKEFVEQQKVPALPLLDRAIRCGNSLIDAVEWQAVQGEMAPSVRAKINPFSWTDEFSEEMARGGFNVLVGNPPYVRIQNMVSYSPDEVTYYQHQHSPFTTARQDNFDKYALFIERSLALVQSDGLIGVIVPHKFMTIQAGRSLRKLLTTDKYLKDIVHFGVKQVFGRGTSNYTCILILSREGCGSVQLEKAGQLENWRYGQTGTIAVIPAAELGEDPWEFADEDARILFARIRANFPDRLSSVAEILVGVQTSADKVFILHAVSEDSSTVTHRWNDKDWKIERGILRPCLHDVTLHAYVPPQANSWIIFPYKLLRNAQGKIRASLIQPDAMKSQFPGCWSYLNTREQELKGRKLSGGAVADRQWYQYGRSQSLTKFDAPKIILPVLSVESRYSYDQANTLISGGGNGPYYMLRVREGVEISNRYLLALLNHPLSEALVRSKTSHFRGGYYSHGKQFIENLPVPIPNDAQRERIETRVKTLIDLCNELAKVRTPHERVLKKRQVVELQREIENEMSTIFGLSIADIEMLRALDVEKLPTDGNDYEGIAEQEKHVEHDIYKNTFPFEVLPSNKAKPFIKHLPLYGLKAAAGKYGKGESVEERGWVKVDKPNQAKDLFIAQVVGKSMEPRIPDGSYCIFRANPVGSLEGKIVLAQYRGPADPDTGGQFTLKRFRRLQKEDSDGNLERTKIWLEPLNPAYSPIEIATKDADDVKVLAVFVMIMAKPISGDVKEKK